MSAVAPCTAPNQHPACYCVHHIHHQTMALPPATLPLSLCLLRSPPVFSLFLAFLFSGSGLPSRIGQKAPNIARAAFLPCLAVPNHVDVAPWELGLKMRYLDIGDLAKDCI